MSAERGDGQVTLWWTAAAGGGAATEWQYRYKADRGYSGWMTVPGGGSPRSFVVSGLTNGVDHTFLVRGTNAVGDGPESAPARTMPMGSWRHWRPTPFWLEAGDREVLISWEYTLAEKEILRTEVPSSVPLLQYRYRTVGGDWGSWRNGFFPHPPLKGDTYTYRQQVTGLRNGTEYEFQMRWPHLVYRHHAGIGSADHTATPLAATGQPLALTAEAGDGEVVLEWPRDLRARRFEYQVRVGGGEWGPWRLASANRLKPVLIVGGLANGTQYGFRVRAVKARAAVSAEAAATPAAPANVLARPALAAEAGSWQVALSWPADSAAAGWEVQRKAEGRPWGRWYPTGVAYPASATGVTVAGLDNDTQYTFRVRATGAGSVKGAASDPVRATPAAPAAVPAKPTGLTLAPTGVGAARLDWSGKGHEAVVAEWQYRHKQAGGEYGDWATASRRGGGATDSTSHTVEGLDVDTDHTFQVRGVNAFGTPGPESDEATIKAAPVAAALPAAGGQVALSWETVPGAASYEYRSRSHNERWAGSSWAGAGTGTSHTFTPHGRPAPIVQMRARFPGGAASLHTRGISVVGRPTDLALEPGTDTVRLQWSDVGTVGVAQWQYRRKVGDGPVQGWVTLDGLGTAHTAQIQATDRDHTFQVRGLDARGAAGPASDWAKMKAAPQTLSAQRTGAEVALSWTAAPSAIPGAVSYEYRARPGGDEWSDEDHPWTGAGTGTSHTFTPTGGATLVVQMRAATAGAAGLLSSELSLLRKPTGLTLEAAGPAAVRLRWNGDGDVAQWQYRFVHPGSSYGVWATLADSNGSRTDYTLELPEPQKAHTFVVRGLDANGRAGPESDEVTIGTAPRLPRVTDAGGGRETLQWEAVPDAVSYQYRIKPGSAEWSDADHPWTSAGAGTSHTMARTSHTDPVFEMRTVFAGGTTGLPTHEEIWGTFTDQGRHFVQTEIDGEIGRNNLWLRQTWAMVKRNNLLQVGPGIGTWGFVLMTCGETCTIHQLGIGPNWLRWMGVYVFEMARTFTGDPRAVGGVSEPIGVGWLYFQHLYLEAVKKGHCGSGHNSQYAEALTWSAGVTEGTVGTYWSWCPGLPAISDPEVQAVARSVGTGETPAWFAEQFQNDDLTWRLEEIWSAVKRHAHGLAKYHLQDSFGGYCSDWDFDGWASPSSTVTNPWNDGGCAPTAPTNTSLVAGAEKLTVSWGAPASAGGAPISYTVQWKESSVTGWDTGVSEVDLPAGATSYIVTGLTAGQEYKVRVFAKNEIGDGDPSAVHTGTPSAGSGAPVLVPSVSVTHNLTTLSVAWDASARATKYDVEYRDSDAATWTSAATDHTTTSLTISGADPSKTYTARVKAKNTHGSSAWRASPPASLPPPDPVGSISVTHNGDSLSVTWDAPARATSYDVAYHGNGADARAAWNRAGTSLTITCDIRPENENQHCVSAEHAYTVSIRARNPGGESTWVRFGPAHPVGPVGSINVTHNGDSLSVSWDAPDGATHYDVTYYPENAAHARAAWNRAGTSLTITCDIRPEHQNQHCVSGEHAYTVSIRARNAVGGTSEWATSAAASPPQPPAAPGGFAAEAGDGEVTLTWSAVAGATGYEYQYKTSGDFGETWSDAGTATSKVVTGLANGTEHTFRLRAVRGSGQSKVAGTPTAPQSATPQPAAPDAVASVSVVHNGSSLSVSWDASARAAGYDVEYQAAGADSWISAATDHTATGLTISSGVDAASSYTVRVKAKNAGGASAWTTSPAAAPPSDPVPPPANVTVTESFGRAYVNWDASAGATGYEYRLKAQGASAWGQWWYIHGGGAKSIQLRPSSQRPLAPGQNYVVQVRAVEESNGPTRYSNPTAEVEFTMPR